MLRQKQSSRRLYAAPAILALVLMAFVPATGAAGPTVTAVAKGLDNPRGLAFSPEGALYVTEAGTGGTTCGIPTPEGEKCFGNTGAVTRVLKGSQERIATGFPSLAAPDKSGAIGPVGISFQGRGGGFVVIGSGGNPADRSKLGPDAAALGHLVQLAASGKWRVVADVAGYEGVANPDGTRVDSNPYAVLALPGKRILADAGGNDLVQSSASGSFSTLAVFPAGKIDTTEFEAVPTSVALGPDGAYYVGTLTGMPFPVGSAQVYRVPAGGGSPENLNVPGLFMPGGLAAGPDGALYVSNYSVFPGQGEGLPGHGEVLRITF